MANNCRTADYVFESSWEVCNKIGGIYTVLSTKSKVLQELYKDRVIFVGPDVWNDEHPSPYFKEYKSLLKGAAAKLTLPMGIKIRCGRWTVPGSPLAVLVDFKGVFPHLDEYFGKMWELYHVDSLHSYGDYAEGCAFGIASAIVISALARHLAHGKSNIIAHFDEWTTAMGLLELKSLNPDIATVFTTHATSIGRSICGNGKPLYDYFDGYNGDQMACELNMESKHSLEKTAAHQADCFTTVSDVTARECTQLLDITPQVVTPNGFEPGFVPGSSRYAVLRRSSRRKLIEVAESLTGRKIDDVKTLLVATSGRNEYRNKGIDLYIDSLLRFRQQKVDSQKDIIAFIMVPAWVKEPQAQLAKRLKGDDCDVAVDFITHRLNNEGHDSIFGRLASVNVDDRASEHLTVIYVPCYLDGHDGVVDIEYYDMLPALDATVFASYYEPWGYTPLESVAFGVPTITTDKAGFGQWVSSAIGSGFSKSGTVVIPRNDSDYNQSADAITDALNYLAGASAQERKQWSTAAFATAAKADWKYFIKHYIEAFSVALKNRDRRESLFEN